MDQQPTLTPQTIGTIFDFVKVIAGGLITVGVLHITADQLTLYISTAVAISVALLGLAGVLYPICRSIQVRTREGSLKLASANLRPNETIVLDSHAEAAALPANVVGPPAVVVGKTS